MANIYPSFTVGSFAVDFVSAMGLAGAGVYALLLSQRLARDARRFWLVAGIGLLWLGADELFGLHEGIEIVLDAIGVPQAPLVHSTNDAFLVVYAALGAVLGLRNLRELLSHPLVLAGLVAAATALVAALISDAFFTPDPTAARVEENGELTGGILFLAAVWLRYRIATRPEPKRPAESPANTAPALR